VVTPRRIVLAPNQSKTVSLAILGKDLAKNQQYFGQVTFHADGHGLPDSVLPVAFFAKQGQVALTHTCAAASLAVGDTTHCEVTAQNLSPVDARATITVSGANRHRLRVKNVTPPAVQTPDGLRWTGTLQKSTAPAVSAITPGGSPAGFLPLSEFGFGPIAGVGDETVVNADVPPFKYGSEEYSKLALMSNGYAVVGGGDTADLDFVPQTFPDAGRPNNVLAPYWTDLDPGSGGSVSIGSRTDGVNTWTILEWNAVPVYGRPADAQSFQIWIQQGDTESITLCLRGRDGGRRARRRQRRGGEPRRHERAEHQPLPRHQLRLHRRHRSAGPGREGGARLRREGQAARPLPARRAAGLGHHAREYHGGGEPEGHRPLTAIGEQRSTPWPSCATAPTTSSTSSSISAAVTRRASRPAYFATPRPARGGAPARPAVRLVWGTFQFDGYLETLDEILESFSADGRPPRASLARSLVRPQIGPHAFRDAD
jgi:hypothetical protein